MTRKLILSLFCDILLYGSELGKASVERPSRAIIPENGYHIDVNELAPSTLGLRIEAVHPNPKSYRSMLVY